MSSSSSSSSSAIPALTLISLWLLLPALSQADDTVCIVGAGIGGASVAHFLREYSPSTLNLTIRMFERNGVVGGRMATVNVSGEFFEAGASILHPKNFHAVNYTRLLNLTVNSPSDDSEGFGIWDGEKFIFKTLSVKSKLPFVNRIVSLANSLLLFVRYGYSLVRMDRFVEVLLLVPSVFRMCDLVFLVQTTVNSFLKYYESLKTRPVFESVDEMLKWAGLHNLTARTLAEELAESGLCPLLIQELVTGKLLLPISTSSMKQWLKKSCIPFVLYTHRCNMYTKAMLVPN